MIDTDAKWRECKCTSNLYQLMCNLINPFSTIRKPKQNYQLALFMDLWLSTQIVVNRKLFKSVLTKQRAIASRNETCVCFAILITQISAIQFKNQHSKSILCTYIEKPSYGDHQKRGIFLLILLRLLFVTRTRKCLKPSFASIQTSY